MSNAILRVGMGYIQVTHISAVYLPEFNLEYVRFKIHSHWEGEGGGGKGGESRSRERKRGWSARGLAGVTRCDSEHIGLQGGCYFTLQSHSAPIPQDILIWSPNPRRWEHSTTKSRRGNCRILFLGFSFHFIK